ncbi:MAG: helix-turn-helix transcriptional regulator [Lachnospiraceae bacterium]|nr:helix-turn-helix transcriptional regulator [Lachnospiraceae bacterium]
MSVEAKIKQYLQDNGISQAHLSRKTLIKPDKLNLTLNENRRLTFEEYENICWALDLEPNVFLEAREPREVA